MHPVLLVIKYSKLKMVILCVISTNSFQNFSVNCKFLRKLDFSLKGLNISAPALLNGYFGKYFLLSRKILVQEYSHGHMFCSVHLRHCSWQSITYKCLHSTHPSYSQKRMRESLPIHRSHARLAIVQLVHYSTPTIKLASS